MILRRAQLRFPLFLILRRLCFASLLSTRIPHTTILLVSPQFSGLKNLLFG